MVELELLVVFPLKLARFCSFQESVFPHGYSPSSNYRDLVR
jgi:hypothetical protein